MLRDSRLVCRAFVALANPPTTRGELRRGYLFCGENPQTALLAAQARHFPARTGKTGPARRGSRIYESGLENRARFLGIFGSESHTDHPVKKRTGIPTQLPGSTLGVARFGRRRRQVMVESECGAVAVGRTYLLPPLSSGGALLVRPWLRFHIHRVGRGSHPPPPPTDRSVRISRTTLFGRWFTALREPAAPDRATAAVVGAVEPAL